MWNKLCIAGASEEEAGTAATGSWGLSEDMKKQGPRERTEGLCLAPFWAEGIGLFFAHKLSEIDSNFSGVHRIPSGLLMKTLSH